MRNVKKELENLQRYFEDKILDDDFSVVKIGRHTAEIKIDGLEFSIWLANDVNSTYTYSGDENAISIVFRKKKAVRDMLESKRFAKDNKSHIDSKKAEFEALKKELNITCN